jgi:hypothetical protein
MKPYSLVRAYKRQRIDQTDVRTFRRFDRADATIVRGMHVTHFKSPHAHVSSRLDQGPKHGACG